jgi:hypothetical protein
MSARDGNNPWVPFVWFVFVVAAIIWVGYEVSQ